MSRRDNQNKGFETGSAHAEAICGGAALRVVQIVSFLSCAAENMTISSCWRALPARLSRMRCLLELGAKERGQGQSGV